MNLSNKTTRRESEQNADCLKWLAKLQELQPAPERDGRGAAPHKPLLLLCVIDMIEAGEISDSTLRLSPSLVFRFQSYWKIVFDRRRNRGEIRMPFHALGTQGIWQTMTADLQLSKHRGTTEVALLNPELFNLFQSESFRANARLLLIQNYFPPNEQVALFAMTNLEAGRCAPLLQKLKAEVKDYQESQRQGRSQRFKIAVVVKYDFTCALTGYRLTTIGGANIVEAAHIQDWSRSRNDDPHNGLALSRNAHWMFDEGLWSADEDHTVLVSKEAFVEKSIDEFSLKALHGRRLVFSNHTTMRPGSQYLAWHRKHKFIG